MSPRQQRPDEEPRWWMPATVALLVLIVVFWTVLGIVAWHFISKWW